MAPAPSSTTLIDDASRLSLSADRPNGSAGTKDAYKLPRSDSETALLLRQHDMISRTIGVQYHPSLGDLSRFSSILDSATGGAAWSVHILSGGLATSQPTRLKPDCRLEACDVSLGLIPPIIPATVSDLFVHNILDPLPDSKSGKFDLIHQRFISAGIQHGEWARVIKNLCEGLSAGGYLHLQEAGSVCFARPNSVSSGSAQTFIGILQALDEHIGCSDRLANGLPSMMRDAGLVNVQVLSYNLPFGAAGAYLGRDYVDASLANARSMFGPNGPVSSLLGLLPQDLTTKLQYGASFEDFMKEVEATGYFMPCAMVVGQKPE